MEFEVRFYICSGAETPNKAKALWMTFLTPRARLSRALAVSGVAGLAVLREQVAAPRRLTSPGQRRLVAAEHRSAVAPRGRGEDLGEDRKSWSFRMTYRAPDRTLTGAEAQQCHDAIALALRVRVGAEVRR